MWTYDVDPKCKVGGSICSGEAFFGVWKGIIFFVAAVFNADLVYSYICCKLTRTASVMY